MVIAIVAIEAVVVISTKECIIATAAKEEVWVRAAEKRIIVFAALEEVSALPTEEHIIANTTVQSIDVLSTIEVIVTTLAFECVSAHLTEEHIIVLSALQDVFTVATAEDVIAQSTFEYVITTTAENRIIATQAGYGIVAIRGPSFGIDAIARESENTAVAAKYWRKAGFDFSCINVFDMFTGEPWKLPGHGFNPFKILNVNSAAFAADALLFAEMLTPRTGGESANAAHFRNASTTAKRAWIIHLKTAEPAARQNPATLYEYAYADAGAWGELLKAMKANPACGGLVASEANKLERIEAQSGEEFSAVMSTIQQDLSFLADPLVREKLSRDDVDFSVLKGHRPGQKGGIVAVLKPLEYTESHAAIERLAMGCVVLVFQQPPLAKNKVTFLIDEAASLGKILRFPNWLATMRKYRVVIWSIWQNIGQVVDLYEKNWQTIIGNCGLVQILGVGDLETAKYTESFLGEYTAQSTSTNSKGESSTSETARSLLKAAELLRLPDGLQIVFIDNLWPTLLYKRPYWSRPELAGRFHPNPYHDKPTPEPGLGDRLAVRLGKLYYGLIWLMAPHPIAACIITAIFALGLAGFMLDLRP